LASAGAILVFGVGVMGVLGTAKAVGSILGARCVSLPGESRSDPIADSPGPLR
jgi:hypothetical protein